MNEPPPAHVYRDFGMGLHELVGRQFHQGQHRTAVTGFSQQPDTNTREITIIKTSDFFIGTASRHAPPAQCNTSTLVQC